VIRRLALIALPLVFVAQCDPDNGRPHPDPTTTTTTVPETTVPETTLPPVSTTTAVPETSSTVTTPPPATTTPPPPSGTQFFEDFSTAAAFTTRFDKGWSGLDPWLWRDMPWIPSVQQWSGDHDMSCGAPTTMRDVHQTADKAEMFWYCAPGGDPAKGHVMTAANSTGYNILWFSPKPYFTNVSRVCWDINLTREYGKWWNVLLIPQADVEWYQAHPVLDNGRQVGDLDLGFSGPGFQAPNAPTTGLFPVLGGEHISAAKQSGGNFTYWEDYGFTADEEFFDVVNETDKAARYQHCMIDNGDGTITLTQARPGGVVDTRVQPGAFPNGPVRVVFQDDMYDPPKREGYDPTNMTWHWDNVSIS
jgi:hypothetical protein